MKKLVDGWSYRNLYIGLFVGIPAILLCGGIWSVYSSTTFLAAPFEPAMNLTAIRQDINVVSYVDDLEIISTRKTEGKFLITIRNKSQKGMNSFYVMSGDHAWQAELVYSDIRDSVTPSTDYEVTVPFSKELYSNGVTIQAALFVDRTGAGNPQYIRIMQDRRKGEKRELAKAKHLLEDLISRRQLISKNDIEELKRNFDSSPADPPDQSESVKLGMNLGRQRFLHALEQLSNRMSEDRTVDLDVELKNVNRRLHKYVSKL